jgi:putative transposase
MERRFHNPHAKTRFTENRLPHRQQDGITYFITFRLADSLTQNLLDQWRSERAAWLKLHPERWNERDEAEYHRRFSSRLEGWLDKGHGSCLLRQTEIRPEVVKVLRNFAGMRYEHHSWVIMPNHVHLLFSLAAGETLERTLNGWKGVSARNINRVRETSGEVWMKDYFDRMVRDAAHFWRCARYIRRNPEKAKLPAETFTLFESDHVRVVLDGTGNG